MSAIQQMFKNMQTARRSLISRTVEIAWAMRGSLQYKDAWLTSTIEREAIRTFIDNRMENESKKMYPVY